MAQARYCRSRCLTKAGEAGLLLTSIPEEYGGGGGDYRHEAILTEEQTRQGIGGWGNRFIR